MIEDLTKDVLACSSYQELRALIEKVGEFTSPYSGKTYTAHGLFIRIQAVRA